MLRATEEWTYVEREVECGVEQEAASRMPRMASHPSPTARNLPEAIRGSPATGQL